MYFLYPCTFFLGRHYSWFPGYPCPHLVNARTVDVCHVTFYMMLWFQTQVLVLWLKVTYCLGHCTISYCCILKLGWNPVYYNKIVPVLMQMQDNQTCMCIFVVFVVIFLKENETIQSHWWSNIMYMLPVMKLSL